jgi:hypothetical protein
MLPTDRRNRWAARVLAPLILAGLPACNAPAGNGHGLLRRAPGGVTVVPAPQPLPQPPPYITYRPAFPLFRPKTFTLSNYAGANYPSVLPGAVLTPSEFRALTGR